MPTTGSSKNSIWNLLAKPLKGQAIWSLIVLIALFRELSWYGDASKSSISSKLVSDLAFIDIDGAVDANLLSENAASAIKFITDYTLGSDDPAEWIKKGIDLGLGKLLDSDSNGSKADIVLAEKQNGDDSGP